MEDLPEITLEIVAVSHAGSFGNQFAKKKRCFSLAKVGLHWECGPLPTTPGSIQDLPNTDLRPPGW